MAFSNSTKERSSPVEQPDFTKAELAELDKVWDEIGANRRNGIDRTARGAGLDPVPSLHGAAGSAGMEVIERRFHAARTHKASSAESILRHVLARRGWTVAFRQGRLSGEQSLQLLGELREYARNWLRHEAEAFLQPYVVVREPDENLPDLLSLSSALSKQEESHRRWVLWLASIDRFFARVATFIDEAIHAGVGTYGVGVVEAADLPEIASQVSAQKLFLANFHEELRNLGGVRLLPPVPPSVTKPPAPPAGAEPELIFDVRVIMGREPSEIPLGAIPFTPKQVIARSELYGNAPYTAAQQVIRRKVIRYQPLAAERRVHVGDDRPCPGCIAEQAKGWSPLGSLLPIGSCECKMGCHCHFSYRDETGRVIETPGFPRKGAALGRSFERADKGNPYHEAHGPKGGQFTSGPSSGGPAPKEGRAPREPHEHPTHQIHGYHDDKGGFKPGVLPKADVHAARKRDEEKEAVANEVKQKTAQPDASVGEPSSSPISVDKNGLVDVDFKKFDRLIEDTKSLRDKMRTENIPADLVLGHIASKRGFDGKPTLANSKDVDAMIKDGGIELYRGVSEYRGKSSSDLVDQFKNGECFYGMGIYGNGIYTMSSLKNSDPKKSAINYSSGSDEGVMRMVLPKDANVIDSGKLDEIGFDVEAQIEKHAMGKSPKEESDIYSSQITEPGRLAAMLGYDAIHVKRNGMFIILNRSKVRVEE